MEMADRTPGTFSMFTFCEQKVFLTRCLEAATHARATNENFAISCGVAGRLVGQREPRKSAAKPSKIYQSLRPQAHKGLCGDQQSSAETCASKTRLKEEKEGTTGWTPAVIKGDKSLGEGKVIALFKSKRKGVILGVEVTSGALKVGQRFRVIDVAGPVYEGAIESLHIEKDVVNEAREGQQVGLQISDWKQAKVGDLVETFAPERAVRAPGWAPRPGVHRVTG